MSLQLVLTGALNKNPCTHKLSVFEFLSKGLILSESLACLLSVNAVLKADGSGATES